MNEGKRLFVAVAIVAALASVGWGQMRNWTDATGKYSVQAELVGTRDGKVQLRRANGQVTTVLLEKLSAADLWNSPLAQKLIKSGGDNVQEMIDTNETNNSMEATLPEPVAR